MGQSVVACIGRIENKEKSAGYILLNNKGQKTVATAYQIKQSIKQGKKFSNIKLSKDGRILVTADLPEFVHVEWKLQVYDNYGDYTDIHGEHGYGTQLKSLRPLENLCNDYFENHYVDYFDTVKIVKENKIKKLIDCSENNGLAIEEGYTHVIYFQATASNEEFTYTDNFKLLLKVIDANCRPELTLKYD
jgi:3D (Asp-Asp-Asp) domain-containing protein